MNEIENEIILRGAFLDEVSQNPEPVYTFVQIENDVYALDSINILEIIKLVELNHPEQMPCHIAGLLEYNGSIINILDIKSVLKIERTPYDVNSMILVLSCNENVYGVLVNKVLDIKKINLKDTQDTPYASKNNFISAIYPYDNVQCSILNIEALSFWVRQHSQNQDEQEIVDGERETFELIPHDPKSLDILRKRKIDFIEKSQKNPYSVFAHKDEFVSFAVANETYCLKMQDIKGFYKTQEAKITKVPCTPEFILGLLNIKGDFICVIDIKNYFHSQKTDFTPASTVIILNSDEFKIGIVADEIGENIQIKPEEIQSLSKQEARPELAQYVKEGEIFLIINVAEMLNNDKLFIR